MSAGGAQVYLKREDLCGEDRHLFLAIAGQALAARKLGRTTLVCGSRDGRSGAVTALVIAVLLYHMPAGMAGMSLLYGAAFGLLPVGWTIFAAMLLYNITVETGQFSVVRRSVAGLSGDARIQAILIGFCFGAFLEGAAGGGTPVAICGAIMIGLGFPPFEAAVLCLIANTSPVAYGGLGTPLIVLSGVTGLPTETLS